MILRGENLIKEYGPKKVVKGVSVEVKKRRPGLLGPNGAGKLFLYDCGIGKTYLAKLRLTEKILPMMPCTNVQKESVIWPKKLLFSENCQ